MTATYLPDISIYQSNNGKSTINWQALKDGGIDLVIIKYGGPTYTDPMMAEHVRLATQYGVKYAFYLWLDPIRSPSLHLAKFREMLDRYDPEFIVGDHEQTWSNWTAWEEYYQGKRTWASVPSLSQAQILAFSKAVIPAMLALSCRSLIYTGWWYCDIEAGIYPGLGSYIKQLTETTKLQVWNAQNFVKPVPPARSVICTTWDQFRTVSDPVYFQRQLSPYNSINKTPLLQYSSTIRAPGQTVNLDWNMFPGTKAEFQTWLDTGVIPGQVVVPPPTSKQYSVTATLGLNIRDAPSLSGKVIGGLAYRTVVSVFETSGDWAKISNIESKWCSLLWLKPM